MSNEGFSMGRTGAWGVAGGMGLWRWGSVRRALDMLPTLLLDAASSSRRRGRQASAERMAQKVEEGNGIRDRPGRREDWLGTEPNRVPAPGSGLRAGHS